MKLEEAGVDVIDVSGGLGHDLPDYLKGEQGFFIPQAQEIKAVVNTPVIGVGGITDPKYADKVIREGRVDLVAVGRALLRDPDWALKAIKAIG
jgi:2,4-dienoyl-CoA reductase-like NADH-dependent reductase (Old Yellow Enzyme family)